MMNRIDQTGLRFYAAGVEISVTLNQLARAVRSKDVARIGEFYPPSFRGNSLGLTRLELTEEMDSVQRYRLSPDEGILDRDGALMEWCAYLGSFDSIEEAALHLHRFEQWRAPAWRVATVRFELIGKPRNSLRFGIDRAFFRCNFLRSDGRLLLRSKEPAMRWSNRRGT